MLIMEEAIRSLSDDELERFIEAGKREQKTRAERERQETIAKIKELARAGGCRSVSAEREEDRRGSEGSLRPRIALLPRPTQNSSGKHGGGVYCSIL